MYWSSTESEYKLVVDLTAELVCLTSLLKEISCPIFNVLIISCDNMGVGSLASNPVYHSRTKHVEVDIYFVRDKVATKKVKGECVIC